MDTELADSKLAWIFFDAYSVQSHSEFVGNVEAIHCAEFLFRMGAVAIKLWPNKWSPRTFRIEAVWDREDVNSLLNDGKYILK